MSTITMAEKDSRRRKPRKPGYSFNLDPELVQRIDELAQQDQRSRNWMATQLLEKGLEAMLRQSGKT